MMNLNVDPTNTRFSLNNAVALAYASKLAYEKEEIIKNKLLEYGFSAEYIEAPGLDPRYDTQLFIAHNSNALVISFRGTQEIRDWITDAKINTRDTKHGKVHEGFDAALDTVWDKIIAILKRIHIYGQPIWITGHSLGGALAVLAAARLTLDIDQSIYKPIHGLYTFGQPRVGDRAFVKALDEEIKLRYFRFVNDNDIVPRVPDRLNLYQEGGSIRFFDAKGVLHDDVGAWFMFLERIKGTLNQKLDMIPSFIEHHFMNKYIKNIEKALEN